MMLKPSIDTLLDKVPSKYSLVILEAKRAHELEAGATRAEEERLRKEEEERKIKEQIAKEKEEGEKI